MQSACARRVRKRTLCSVQAGALQGDKINGKLFLLTKFFAGGYNELYVMYVYGEKQKAGMGILHKF